MSGRFAAMVIAGCIFGLAAFGHGQQRSDAMSLRGTWTCVSATIDGRPLAEEAAKQLKLTMTADRFKTERGDQVLFDSTYAIDATKTPPQIDMIGTEGELKGKPALGIYKLDANQLTLCYVMPGSPRPTAFDSQPQSGTFLIVWKRMENP
jgi:uncharacterized protein (TIGR03067 family)